MSKKSGKIAGLIGELQGGPLDAHYLGYFKCFNTGLYYEAHDVLEELWLANRQGPNYFFYKGLIQLAGAFVHLQKNRLKPALALFKLAETNLRRYPALHEHLDTTEVLELIARWSNALVKSDFATNPLASGTAPHLSLVKSFSEKTGTLIIATRNKHKVGEIRQILGGGWHCLSLADFPEAPEVVEDQLTFAGNAGKKAAELARWLVSAPSAGATLAFPVFVLADDSGLEVDALGGAPGIYSARFAAMDSGSPGNLPDSENNAKLLRLLEGIPLEKRTARFRCVLSMTRINSPDAQEPDWMKVTFDGSCEGRVSSEARGEGGFGYDPLFFPEGHDTSFAELGEEVKNRISHRARALAKLKEFLAV